MKGTHDILANDDLPLVLLGAVSVAAIDDDLGGHLRLCQLLGSFLDKRSRIVGSFGTSTQDHMCVGVALQIVRQPLLSLWFISNTYLSFDDAAQPLSSNAQEYVAILCALAGIDRNLH